MHSTTFTALILLFVSCLLNEIEGDQVYRNVRTCSKKFHARPRPGECIELSCLYCRCKMRDFRGIDKKCLLGCPVKLCHDGRKSGDSGEVPSPTEVLTMYTRSSFHFINANTKASEDDLAANGNGTANATAAASDTSNATAASDASSATMKSSSNSSAAIKQVVQPAKLEQEPPNTPDEDESARRKSTTNKYIVGSMIVIGVLVTIATAWKIRMSVKGPKKIREIEQTTLPHGGLPFTILKSN